MGECFVFDERVTINKTLMKGKYTMLWLSKTNNKKDTKSKKYIKGVCCPYCLKIDQKFKDKFNDKTETN